jgi:60kDa lysophospholipase
MGMSLRGEITVPASSSLPKSHSSISQIEDSLDNIHDVLSHVVRLSTVRPHRPKVVITSPKLDIAEAASDSAAPWSWTAAEATSTETALLPFLTHLAVSKDDEEGLMFCLKPEGRHGGGVGQANAIDPASGRSPLHVAALNGSFRCIKILLQGGALVHLRDGLGHTALYYVSALPIKL